MQTELKPRPADLARRASVEAANERSELALLAEFMRAESVASLASDIAERLGADARGDDLIAAAALAGVSAAADAAEIRTPHPGINQRAGLRR
jgi:hypothetical protein